MRVILCLLFLSSCIKYGYVGEKNWDRAYKEEANIVDYNVVDVTPSVVMDLLNTPPTTGCFTDASASESQPYHVQAGDKLFIKLAVINTGLPHEINDNTDLVHILPQAHKSKEEASFIINNAGEVSLPYTGSVAVAGKTIAEINAQLTAAFRQYFKEPFVEVKLFTFNSQYTSVTGEVHQIGRQPLSDVPLTLIKAIEQAGGIKETADLQSASIQRKDGSRIYVNLAALLHQGDVRANHTLKDGDILNIPYTNGNKIFVTGEVNDRKVLKIPAGKMSLTEALTEGNGPHHWAADRSRVYLIRGGQFSGHDDRQNPCFAQQNTAGITTYHFNMNMPQTMALADRFMLQPRDVLYVATREITQWNRFFTQLVPSGVSQLLPTP